MSKFIAGAYSLSYNSKALGQTADGIRMTYEIFKRIITGHLAGQTPQDAVYQGQNRTSSFRLIEADEAGIADLLYPYTATIGNEWQLGVIGLLDVRGQGTGSPVVRAKSLVLTAITGTTAANDAAASMTLPLSILHDRFPVDVLLAPDLKEVPIRMQHYVDMAEGTPVFGSST